MQLNTLENASRMCAHAPKVTILSFLRSQPTMGSGVSLDILQGPKHAKMEHPRWISNNCESNRLLVLYCLIKCCHTLWMCSAYMMLEFHGQNLDMPWLFFDTCLMVPRYVLDFFWDSDWTLCMFYDLCFFIMSLLLSCCLGLGESLRWDTPWDIPWDIAVEPCISEIYYVFSWTIICRNGGGLKT